MYLLDGCLCGVQHYQTFEQLGPTAGYWHPTASQRLSCSCELVPPSIHSHSPQNLPPYKLSVENMPTWL